MCSRLDDPSEYEGPRTVGARGVLLAYANDWHLANCEGNVLIDAPCSCGLAEWVGKVDAAKAMVAYFIEGTLRGFGSEDIFVQTYSSADGKVADAAMDALRKAVSALQDRGADREDVK